MPDSQAVVPGLAGVPVAESAISYIDGNRGLLEYRGVRVEELAAQSSFEEVAYLLLYGRRPDPSERPAFDAALSRHRALKPELIDFIRAMPADGHPMDALQASVAALGMYYPARDVANQDVRHDSVVRLLAKLPSLVATFHRLRRGEPVPEPRNDLNAAANFLWMLLGREPNPDHVRMFDVCLILHADHTMNASTFSARVTASTLADPYTVVSSAIGTLSGPLHGGANERVLELLEGIGSVEAARPAIEAMIDRRDKIMGFGHRVYKVKDPRAVVLQSLAETLLAGDQSPIYALAREVEQVVGEHLGAKGIYPNVDYFSGIVYSVMGIPSDLFTPIFAMSRVAGWLAHWLEQLEGNRIYRPSQVYVGQHSDAFVET